MKHRRSFTARSWYYHIFRHIRRIADTSFAFYTRVKTPMQPYFTKSLLWTNAERMLSKRFYFKE